MIYVLNYGTGLTVAQANALNSFIALGTTPGGSALTKDVSGNFVNTAISGGSGLTVGTTTITSGNTTRVLFDNAGVLGEYVISGSGNVAMTTSPVFTTPTLGVASATSLATSAATPLLLTNGQLVNIALTSQTVGATTLTIPNFASVSDTFAFLTLAQAFTNKTYNGLTVTSSTGTLTIVNGGSLITAGAFPITLTATASTGVTLPTSGTLYGTLANSITSAQLLSSVSDETGTGALVFANTPTLVTPVLGAATATSINGLIITTTAGTLTVANNASAQLITSGNFALTLTSTATTNSTFPTGTDTLMGLAAVQTVTGAKTFNDTTLKLAGATSGASTLKAPAVASTYVHTLPAMTTTLASVGSTTEASNTATVVAIAGIHHTHTITALAAADTFGVPTVATGALDDTCQLVIRIKDNATARALTWNAIFRASTDLALPSTTVLSKTLYVGFKYNVADTKWDLLSVLNNI